MYEVLRGLMIFALSFSFFFNIHATLPNAIIIADRLTKLHLRTLVNLASLE